MQGVIEEELYTQLLNGNNQVKIPPLSTSVNMEVQDEISLLKELIISDGFGPELKWVQKVLLDVRQAKLDLMNRQMGGLPQFCEPVVYYYTLLNMSVPIVSWSCRQNAAVRNKAFISLLRQLGFHSPTETYKIYHRIPSFWSPDYLLSVADKFKPYEAGISENHVPPKWATTSNKNDSVDDTKVGGPTQSHQPFAVPRAKNAPSISNYTPLPNMPRSWLDVVTKSKSISSTDPRVAECEFIGEALTLTQIKSGQTAESEDLECASVLSVCDTQASDLTRMCISDEDEDAVTVGTWA